VPLDDIKSSRITGYENGLWSLLSNMHISSEPFHCQLWATDECFSYEWHFQAGEGTGPILYTVCLTLAVRERREREHCVAIRSNRFSIQRHLTWQNRLFIMAHQMVGWLLDWKRNCSCQRLSLERLRQPLQTSESPTSTGTQAVTIYWLQHEAAVHCTFPSPWVQLTSSRSSRLLLAHRQTTCCREFQEQVSHQLLEPLHAASEGAAPSSHATGGAAAEGAPGPWHSHIL
jgi:hypothetical protein